MFKMLLVEDEPATIEGIKSAINWSLMDISICGEATDGIQAIQMIDELEPDIVLCDIRMPKLDGISVIQQIQPRHPDIKVIFLSGYSDKEYLKSAIRLNVVDYVYKPFELAELIQAVEKAKAACNQNYTDKDNGPDNDVALTLIQKGWVPPSSLNNTSVKLDDYLVTIIVRFNASLETINDVGAIASSRYYRDFKKVFSEIFGDRYVVSNINNAYILHTNVCKDFLSSIDIKIFKQLGKLFSIAKKHSRYMTIGISNPVKSSIYLKDSYRQAKNAIMSAFLTGYGKLIFYKDLSTSAFIPSNDVETMFFRQINNNNIASAIDFLEEYIDYMCRCRPDDIPAIKDELAAISFRLNQKLQRQDHIQQKYITELFNHALDIKDIKEYLLQLLEQIQSNINSLDSKGRIIFDVENFILKNYDKELSINKIAEHVYLTPTYLCQLYKKTTGRTLNQFILEVKMNKAKLLLTNTNLKIGEIADRLGYTNQNYFTKTFTKYFGINPSTFRNKQL